MKIILPNKQQKNSLMRDFLFGACHHLYINNAYQGEDCINGDRHPNCAELKPFHFV